MKWPRKSYSQMGEDLIIENNLGNYGLNISNIKYIDIGCNHPVDSNNTFLFYENGSKGLIIEPDVSYKDLILSKRPNDIYLDCAVSTENSIQDFYILTAHSLNTLSKFHAELACQSPQYGIQKIENKISVQTKTINSIMEEFGVPNLISIDVEGLDFDILKSIDFNKFYPEIICIEVNFNKADILAFIKDKYEVLCDNTLNLILGKIK